MIVPVWISLTTTPETEELVYALLDMQGSNTFVDKGVCERMGADLKPVKLKLTTMMGKDSFVKSERVSGLLLIGCECSRALAPRRIITGGIVRIQDRPGLEHCRQHATRSDRSVSSCVCQRTSTSDTSHCDQQLALVRLKRLKRKLERNPKFKADYVKFMEGVFKDGDAERAEHQFKAGHVWYIPHQGVYHPRKREKIKVGFLLLSQV